MKYLLLLIAIFGIQLTVLYQSRSEKMTRLSPEQQREDVRVWLDTFEKNHPGLYRWESKESIHRVMTEVLKRSKKERNVLEFWRDLSLLNAKVRCGHAPLGLSEELRNKVLGSKSLIPPILVINTKDGIFIKKVLGDTNQNKIQAGEKLISINGHRASSIISFISERLHADGFNKSVKRYDIEQKFAALYVLFIEAFADNYSIETTDKKGKRKEIDLQGTDLKTWSMANRPGKRSVPIEFKKINDAVGYLKILTLSDGIFRRAKIDFERKIESIFQKNKNLSDLILDIRGISGGSDYYTVYLLQYLLKKDFRLFDRIEVTKHYVPAKEGGERALVRLDKFGRRVVKNSYGLSIQKPKPNSFKGKLHVIIDGGTFSAGADLAAALHRTYRAVFYGEETGGGYAGNTSGPGTRLKLPNLGAIVPVRQWIFWTKDVDPNRFKGGVPPHKILHKNVKSEIAEIDSIFEQIKSIVLN